MIGDISDIFSRLKAQIPASWFKSSPNFDATLQGPAWALSTIYSQITYATLQTRIATATDGYLDLIANDFFGTSLPRLTNEIDGDYRARILANLFVKGPTRANMSAVLKLVTGTAPTIFEPSNTSDSGGWGGPSTDNVNPTGTPSIYRQDWQGNQLLYPTARTNLLPNSQDLTAASWTVSGAAITANATTAPDGTTTADKEVESATLASHYCFPSLQTVTSGVLYTQTIYAKGAERTILQIGASTGFDTARYQNYNLSTGVLGQGSLPAGATASITSVGNGWYRCQLTCPTTGTSARMVFACLLTDVVSRLPTYSGDGTSGLYLWGAQLELGGTPTGYIPTTNAAVTVTDYVLSSLGLVALATPPVMGAQLSWSGTGTDAVTGAAVTANNTFFGGGNGIQTDFQLVTPSIVDSGFYWDTDDGQWGAPMPYQSFVTAYRPSSALQSLGEWDEWRFMWDAYGAWSDSQITSVTDAAIIAAVESTRMTGTVVWLQIVDAPQGPIGALDSTFILGESALA